MGTEAKMGVCIPGFPSVDIKKNMVVPPNHRNLDPLNHVKPFRIQAL